MRGAPFVGGLAVDAAFDVEQRVEPLHCVDRDRIDYAGAFATALLARGALDIGEFAELAARMGRGTSLKDRSRSAGPTMEHAMAAIGVGLRIRDQDTRCACGCWPRRSRD